MVNWRGNAIENIGTGTDIALAQTGARDVAATVTIPAGKLLPGDVLRIRTFYEFSGGGGLTQNANVTLDGQNIYNYSNSADNGYMRETTVAIKSTTTASCHAVADADGWALGAVANITIDTSTDMDVQIAGTAHNAANAVDILLYTIEILKAT